jgi:hypothetical protein
MMDKENNFICIMIEWGSDVGDYLHTYLPRYHLYKYDAEKV